MLISPIWFRQTGTHGDSSCFTILLLLIILRSARGTISRGIKFHPFKNFQKFANFFDERRIIPRRSVAILSVKTCYLYRFILSVHSAKEGNPCSQRIYYYYILTFYLRSTTVYSPTLQALPTPAVPHRRHSWLDAWTQLLWELKSHSLQHGDRRGKAFIVETYMALRSYMRSARLL
jgi:hypothetical protein